MRDDDWLRPVEDEASPRRRSWLFVAAIVPWVVVGAAALWLRAPDYDLDVTAAETASDDASDAADTSDTGDTSDAGDTLPPTLRDAEDGPGTTVLDLTVGDDRAVPRDPTQDASAMHQRAIAVATVIARSFATAVEPRLVIEGARPEPGASYAEHLVAEEVRLPSPGPDGPALVTMVAVVLDAADDLVPRVDRLAVPLVIEEGQPQPAGRPWWLPPVSVAPTALATKPTSDPDLGVAVRSALDDAGMSGVTVQAVATTEHWPPVVVSGTDQHGHPVELWFEGTDQLALVGTTPAPAADGVDR